MFAQRLDFIMNLTNTKTSVLARAASIDSSYVSKLRNGSRKLPKDPVFLTDMCDYFAKHIKDEHQVRIVCDTLNISMWPDNISERSALLQNWFLNQRKDLEGIEILFQRLLNVSGSTNTSVNFMPNKKKDHEKLYYGIEGKREAVLSFFDIILQSKEPTTLYLNSDEDMSWLIDDKAYTKTWSEMLRKVLLAGNRIVIIHNIKRNLDEMIHAVAEWAPVYVTGAIQSYYYPRIRDDLYQRSLFVADGLVALSSVSISRDSREMLNELYTDKNAVKALKKEFDNTLELCKKLSLFINSSRINLLRDVIQKMENRDLTFKSLSKLPVIFTLPESVAKSIQERYPDSKVYEAYQKLSVSLDKVVSTSKYVHMVQDPKTLFASGDEKYLFPYGDFCGDENIEYTKEELLEHYKYLDYLQEKYPNFTVKYSERPLHDHLLFSMDSIGFVMAKTMGKNVVSIFMEDNIVSACRNYLEQQLRNYSK